MPAATIGAIAAVAGAAYNAYQQNEERKRQRKQDDYNRAINTRDYLTQLAVNNPSYQKQVQRNAGFNVLASGNIPDMAPPGDGSPLSGTPIGPLDFSGVSSAFGTMAAQQIQDEGNEIKRKELALAKDKLEFEKNKQEAEIIQQKVNYLAELWFNGFDHDKITEEMHKIAGYENFSSFDKDSNGTVTAKFSEKLAKANADKAEEEAKTQQKMREKIDADIEKEAAETDQIRIANRYLGPKMQSEIALNIARAEDARQSAARIKLEGDALAIKNARDEFDNILTMFGGKENLTPNDIKTLAGVFSSKDGKEAIMSYLAEGYRQLELSESERRKKLAQVSSTLDRMSKLQKSQVNKERTQAEIDEELYLVEKILGMFKTAAETGSLGMGIFRDYKWANKGINGGGLGKTEISIPVPQAQGHTEDPNRSMNQTGQAAQDYGKEIHPF